MSRTVASWTIPATTPFDEPAVAVTGQQQPVSNEKFSTTRPGPKPPNNPYIRPPRCPRQPFQVADAVALPVEMACEGRSREGELVACKFESRFADRGPLRDRRHVDIGQQARFAVLVQPFVERSSGVDRRCEGHQIVGGTDALGRRDVASVFGVGHLVLIARLDQADVVHVVGFVDLHHHVVAAVVRSQPPPACCCPVSRRC